MGKVSILTPDQKIVLDKLKTDSFLNSQFYFTGGTALSEIYLQHRYSEDLDFFSDTKFDNQDILAKVTEWSKELHFTFEPQFKQVVYIFNCKLPNGTDLKIDFAYYPCKNIKPRELFHGVRCDSLDDIAVNKLLTASQRTDVKDFVDLYFILQTYSVWDLIEGVRVKFNVKTEPLFLASDFLKIDDFERLPRMIKPVSLEDMRPFFRKKAKELGLKILT